jgi:phage terminase large subunit-like protein
MDNSSNLAAKFLRKIQLRYEGTRLGRQELNAEMLGDIPNALWTLSTIDLYRIRNSEPDAMGRAVSPATMSRVLVAVDPAITSNGEGESDEHGIIAGGLQEDTNEALILEDASIRGTPLEWATAAIALHDRWEADAIVIETNQGGDMVAQTIRSIRSNISIIEVWATRGKHVRADPISSLYQQGRIHHVGAFPELETQMTMMTSAGYEGEGSPDRLDALVWLLTELFPSMVTKPKPAPVRAIPMVNHMA